MNAEAALVAANDRRQGGRWGRLQGLKNDAIYALVRAVLPIAVRVPERALRTFGEALGHAVFGAWRSGRRTALGNLARALPGTCPGERARLARRACVALGGHLADAVASLAPGSPLARLPFAAADRETLARAQREGRGVLFVSAHLGPWERVAATLVDAGVPLTVVARESYDPRLTALYDRLRGARGVRSIYRGAPGSGLAMLRVLRGGGVLAVPMDLRSRVPSIDVPFLGSDAPTPRGPAQLALRARAAVVVGTAAPGEAGPILTATRLDVPLGHDAHDVRALTIAINAELSRRILALPEQWPWMHPRWAPHRTCRGAP